MTCNVQPIEYGAFIFSSVPIKSKLTVVPMYAEDGITVKFLKTSITVEFIFTVPVGQVDGAGVNSADDYIDNAKAALSERGQALKYN